MKWFWNRRDKISPELHVEANERVRDPVQDPFAMQWELIAMILEVAQVHDDTDECGKVFMPDEKEWGLIVGQARRMATR